MNTVSFEEKENIKMIAHRGVSGLERENTCPAFVAAGVKSYYGIETDVHITRDGKFILAHDDSLKRIAGLDLVIENTDMQTLRSVRLKDVDGKTERGDLFLPTPEEYFSVCKKYGKQAVFELKNRIPDEKVWELAELIQGCGWFERTTFISFNGDNLVALRKRYPAASVQFLAGAVTEENFAFMKANDFDADIDHRRLTEEAVARLHAEGLVVNCWTVNTIEAARKMKAYGVDMITTNILE